ncbi:MAG: SpoIIE family protein phosphatase, partial [Anaerolineae bacterium]
VAKYAAGASGDTLEMIERPHGGLSAVLVDGQRSGRSARIISNIVARKAVSLLGEGVRDGAVGRAVHDYLRTHRNGQVSAELQMVSVDLATRSLVISRNARCPSFIWSGDELQVLEDDSEPIGIRENTKPRIVELPLVPWCYVIQCTDGLPLALDGQATEGHLRALLVRLLPERPDAQCLADALLAAALQAEARRPRDDISVLVIAVLPDVAEDGIRRLSARFPVQRLPQL